MVVACLAALGLRGADWRMQGFAWISITILLAAVAVAEAVHAAGINLPQKPAAGVMAVIPWVLLLLVFGALAIDPEAYPNGPCRYATRRSGQRGSQHRRPLGPVVNQRSAGRPGVRMGLLCGCFRRGPGRVCRTPLVRVLPEGR